MDIEDSIEFLKNTDKPILYKKGMYGRKIPVKDKNEAVELYKNCEDGYEGHHRYPVGQGVEIQEVEVKF